MLTLEFACWCAAQEMKKSNIRTNGISLCMGASAHADPITMNTINTLSILLSDFVVAGMDNDSYAGRTIGCCKKSTM